MMKSPQPWVTTLRIALFSGSPGFTNMASLQCFTWYVVNRSCRAASLSQSLMLGRL